MSDNRFRFTIRSRHGDGDRLRLDDLADELSQFYRVLAKMDHLVSRKRTATMYFQITELKYSSPATVEVAAIPSKPEVDFTNTVGERFVRGIREIQTGRVPEDFDDALVGDFKRIGATTKREVAAINVEFGNEQAIIESEMDALITDILGGDSFAEGSITGMLEQINVHGGKNEFRIYPIAGPSFVKCKFDDSIKKDVKAAIERNITIYGRLGYKPRAKFPFCAEVKSLDIHPLDSNLPTFSSLKGIAPNATGDLSSEEFVRGIRGGE